MKKKSIFLDGKMVQAREKFINSLAPGIVQGEGAFETMRVFNGTIFMLDEHFDRLLRGLRLLKIRSPYSKMRWKQYLYRTINANALKDAKIRLALWKSNKQLHISIVCQDIPGDFDSK